MGWLLPSPEGIATTEGNRSAIVWPPATVEDFAITLAFGGEQNRLSERKLAGGLIKGIFCVVASVIAAPPPSGNRPASCPALPFSAGIRHIDGGQQMASSPPA
jgi:hypothetical protein